MNQICQDCGIIPSELSQVLVHTVLSSGSWSHSNYSKESYSIRICHQILFLYFAVCHSYTKFLYLQAQWLDMSPNLTVRTDKQVEYTQTDRQNEANGHRSKLCKFAYNLLRYLVFQITPISITASNYGYTV